MSEPMTDAERLAAILDGRLADPERTDALDRLSSSAHHLAAFADAAAVLRELEEEDATAIEPVSAPAPRPTSELVPEKPVIVPPSPPPEGAESAPDPKVTPLPPPPERRKPRIPTAGWLALAAVLAALALVPLLRGPRGGEEGAAAVVERLAAPGAGLPPAWDGRPWGATRAPDAALTPRSRAVRLGARLVDLELAVRARDPRTAEAARDVAALLEGYPAGGAAASVFREVARRSGEPPGALAPLLERGGAGVEALADGPWLRLGAWAEAARVAAARRDEAFFHGAAPAVPPLEGEAARALERLRSALPDGGPPEWAELEGALAALLAVLGA